MKSIKLLKGFLIFLLLGSASLLHAVTITGNVIDKTNEPLIGVNVSVKGATQGTITDFDGNYKLDVANENAILVFSYVGYTAQEVVVGKRTSINITLQDDAQALDEVVVVGYGVQRKRDVTGAITQYKPGEDEGGKFSSVDNLLQGKVAGLNVSGSASQPGAAVSVKIRGANSLRGDNEPLYVIDNIPQASPTDGQGSEGDDYAVAQNPLTSLNPQDIESIEVLKDASATAIYGSRGANGVIIITTKKGQAGNAKVNITANFTLAEPYKYLSVLDMNDYANYYNSKGNQRYFFEGSEVRYAKEAGYDPTNSSSYSVLEARNWQKEIYRTAFSQNYNLTVNGGTEKFRYYISGAFKNIEGLVKTTGMKQGDFRMNTNSDLAKNLTLNTSINASVKQNNMMSGGSTKGGASGSIVRSALDYVPHEYPESELESLTPENRTNALSWLTDYNDITDDYTFRGSLDLNWKIANWISYSLRAGGNMRWMERSRWFGLGVFKGLTENGYLENQRVQSSNYTVENLLNFNKDWDRVVTLSGVLGVTYDSYATTNKTVFGSDFNDFTLGVDGLHFANKLVVNQPIQGDYQLLSYLARANVGFLDGRYLLTASFRADGSSKFAPQNRWGYFPSTSVAWRLEQEDFMSETKSFLDQLKVRAGWGMTGNQGIASYQTLYDYQKYGAYATIDGATVGALTIARVANADIKWETTSSFNAGIDFSFFNSRLSGSADYYYKRTSDLLIYKNIAPSSGFSSMTINQGSIDNQGVEVTLNADLIRTKDWKWSVGGNISINKSTISSLGLPEENWGALSKDGEKYSAYLGNTLGDLFGPANIFIKGMDPGLFWGYQTEGIINDKHTYVDENGVEKNVTYRVGTNNAGNIKIVDQNGDGVINADDKTIIGNPNPKFTYGFNTSVSYKGIRLSAQFIGKQGNQVLNTGVYYNELPGTGTQNIVKHAFDNAWTAENQSQLYPSTSSAKTSLNGVVIDRYIQDASYLRLSDVTIAYDFPSALVRKAKFTKVGVFLSAQNLFVITKYTGYDPEVNSFAFDGTRVGVDMNGFPNPRSFTLGLNIGF